MAARATRVQRSDVGAWLITCNPRKWDIEGYRASGRTSIKSWAVSGYRSELMQRNDLVFLWVTGSRLPGPTPGLRGIGRIAGPAALNVSEVTCRRLDRRGDAATATFVADLSPPKIRSLVLGLR